MEILGHRPAQKTLRGMEIDIPVGEDLPPQPSPELYEQRPLPPIPSRSPARGVPKPLSAAAPQRRSVPPAKPPCSPARVSSIKAPPEYWRQCRDELVSTAKTQPLSVHTRSASEGQNSLTPPPRESLVMRSRPWSLQGTEACAEIASLADSARSPALTPTLHNSPDKIKQMIGHDVNINFDTSHPRAQSGVYRNTAAYTAPPSPTQSSCYSGESLDTTMSEPIPYAPAAHEYEDSSYDEDADWTLVAGESTFDMPAHKRSPGTRSSMHVDPLLIRRRTEVMSGEFLVVPDRDGQPWKPEPTGSPEPHDIRQTSEGQPSYSDQAAAEEYIIKDLYHTSTAQIAASSKRREMRHVHSSPPERKPPMVSASKSMIRRSLPSRLLGSQRRPNRLHPAVPEAEDQPSPTPSPTRPLTSTFEPDESPNYIARVFKRRSGTDDGGGSPTASPPPGRRDPRTSGVRFGIYDLVAQVRKGAGFLTKDEKRKAKLEA